MKKKPQDTTDQFQDELTSLYDAHSNELSDASPEQLPIFSGLTPEELPYEEQVEIARGGMKTVLKVFDPKTGRDVALARLNPGSPEELYEPFLREARLTARLDHPNIITIYDIGLDEKSAPYFTMELKNGLSLDQIITDHFEPKSKILLNDLINIFLKICDAIDYAHSQDVIHLDLKPENIQVGKHGEVIVCDWGLGKLIGNKEYDGGEFDRLLLNPDLLNNMTLSGHIKGTPGYMAPEQAEGDRAKTRQTDIYALGAILYKMLTNLEPIEGETSKAVLSNTGEGNICPPSQRCPQSHIPTALCAIAMKALATKPADRYPSVQDMRQDLISYQNGFSTWAENAGFLREIRLFYQRQKKIMILSGLFLLVLITAAFISFASIKRSEQAAVNALDELTKEKTERMRLGQEAAPRFYNRAQKELAKGNMDAAFRQAKTAHALNPQDLSIGNLLATLYFLQGDYQLAAQTFGNSTKSVYRPIDRLNDVYVQNLHPEQELEHVESVLELYESSVPTPLTTAVFLHLIYDKREQFSEQALRHFTINKELSAGILNFAAQQPPHPATAKLVSRVLETLSASPNWAGRRIPATLGMELTTDPSEERQFRALIPDNLALGQPVIPLERTAGNPEQVSDGIISAGSYWSCSPYPSTVDIDLGDVHQINTVRIFINPSTSEYARFKYAVSQSSTGKRFQPVTVLQHKGPSPIEGYFEHTVPPTNARFVRLKVLHHRDEEPLQVREIEVY